jgi:hypothetical protein
MLAQRSFEYQEMDDPEVLGIMCAVIRALLPFCVYERE